MSKNSITEQMTQAGQKIEHDSFAIVDQEVGAHHYTEAGDTEQAAIIKVTMNMICKKHKIFFIFHEIFMQLRRTTRIVIPKPSGIGNTFEHFFGIPTVKSPATIGRIAACRVPVLGVTPIAIARVPVDQQVVNEMVHIEYFGQRVPLGQTTTAGRASSRDHRVQIVPGGIVPRGRTIGIDTVVD